MANAILIPSGMYTQNTFAVVPSSSYAHQVLSDNNLSTYLTYDNQASSQASAVYDCYLSGWTSGNVTINNVTVTASCDGTSSYSCAYLYINGANSLLSSIYVPYTGTNNISWSMDVNPITHVAWTNADIVGLKVGIGMSVDVYSVVNWRELTVNVTFTAPVIDVATTSAAEVDSVSANLVGNINSLNGNNATAYGFCWSSTNTLPTISDSKNTLGTKSTTGAFSYTATGLTPITLYYVRAYATSAYGTYYGAVQFFTTKIGSATDYGFVYSSINAYPTITDTKVSLGSKSTTGSFTSPASGLIPGTLYYYRSYATNRLGTTYGEQRFFTTNIAAIDYGFVYSTTNSNPTIADTKISNGSNGPLGAFSKSLTGLTNNKTYYVRPYATTTAGTSYGTVNTFNTLTGLVTLSATTAASSITADLATSGGTISVIDGSPITQYGICWGTSANPTTANSKTTQGTMSTGTFTSSMTGLTPSTIYHVRSYATTAYGTTYGPDISFTTLSGLAVLNLASMSMTASNLLASGTVTNKNGTAVTEYGFVWATHTAPIITDSINTTAGDIVINNAFNINLDTLTPSTLYYVRAYAKTIYGTTYSNELSQTSQSGIPVLQNTAATGITYKIATGNASIDNLNGTPITQYGHVWGTSSGPTTALSTKTTLGTTSTTGSYTGSITGLLPNITYYVRSYATNRYNTYYGPEISFTTLKIQYPVSQIPVLISKTNNSMTLNCNADAFKEDFTNATFPYVSYSNMTVNSYTGSGVVNMTSTTSDPMISMYNLGDFDPNIYRYMEIKYRILSGGTTTWELFFCNSLYTSANGAQYLYSSALTADTQWHTSVIDCWTHANWKTQGYITGWRYDWATTSGVNMEVDYIRLYTDNTQVQIVCNGQTKASGSTWTGLTRYTDYVSYGYLPGTTTHYQGANSSNLTVKTYPDIPVMATNSIKNKVFKLDITGTITDFGGEPNITVGFCYATHSNPTLADNVITNGSTFSTNIAFNNLTPNLVRDQNYYIKSYATNSYGTGYGSELQAICDGVIFKLNQTSFISMGDFIEDPTITNTTYIDNDGNIHAPAFVESSINGFGIGNNGTVYTNGFIDYVSR